MAITKISILFVRHQKTWKHRLCLCASHMVCCKGTAGYWGDCTLIIERNDTEEAVCTSYSFSETNDHFQVQEGVSPIYENVTDMPPDYAMLEIPWTGNKDVCDRLEEFLKAHTQRRPKHHWRGYWNVLCCFGHSKDAIVTPPHSVHATTAYQQWRKRVLHHKHWITPEFILTALMYANPDWVDAHADHLDNPYQTSANALYEMLTDHQVFGKSIEVVLPVAGYKVEVTHPFVISDPSDHHVFME